MTLKKSAVLIALAIAFVLAAIALLQPSSQSGFPNFVLTNGARVTVVSAEFPNPANRGGWTTLNRYDGGWRDKLYPKLPRSLLGKFGIRPVSRISVGSNLAVWLKFGGVPAAAAGSPPPEYFRLRVVDPAGFASPDNWPMMIVSNYLALYTIPNYPHLSSNVTLQLVFSDWKRHGADAVGPTFSIFNSYSKPPATWMPEAMPATRLTNNLTVALNSLQTGLASLALDGSMISGYSLPRCYTRAEFELLERGQPTTNWRVLHLAVDGPTGETVGQNPVSFGWINSRFLYVFEGALWSEEPAWEVQAELQRTAEFPDSELWSEGSLPLPGETTAHIGVTREFDGVQLLQLSIARTTSGLLNVRRPPNIQAVSLNVSLGNHDPDLRVVLVKISENHGVVLPVQSTTETHIAGTSTYEYSVFVTTNASSLNATFAITRSRFVTFRVKPAFNK